jgi:microcystin degradation protein MlrC
MAVHIDVIETARDVMALLIVAIRVRWQPVAQRHPYRVAGPGPDGWTDDAGFPIWR